MLLMACKLDLWGIVSLLKDIKIRMPEKFGGNSLPIEGNYKLNMGLSKALDQILETTGMTLLATLNKHLQLIHLQTC
jgi:hypothetical protein